MSTTIADEVRTRVDEDNPWPGPLAFDEASERFFNGRAEEAADLRRLVLDASFTVLFGASGLGKTSLLQAGLFPLSRKDNLLPVYVRLDLSQSAPSFGEQVKTAFEREAAAHGIDAPPFQPSESLWHYLHRGGLELWSPQNRLITPLLVLDQFEEVFTVGATNQTRIDEMRVELADLVENRIPQQAAVGETIEESLALDSQRYKLLISFRREFLPDFEDWKRQLPSIMRNRLHLLPMSGEQAFEAVHGGAPYLVNELVAERIVRKAASQDGTGAASRESGLPLSDLSVDPALLSIFCQGLNDRRKALNKAQIDQGLLDEAGNKIIEDFYQRAIGDQPEPVRSFIANNLITEEGFRDSCDVGDARKVHHITRQQLDVLVDRRLLRVEPHGPTERVELTHDVLTRVVREEREHYRESARARKQRRRRRVLTVIGVVLVFVALVFFYLYRNAAQEADRANAALKAWQEENLRGRLESLDYYGADTLADEVIDSSSPVISSYARHVKSSVLSDLGNHVASIEELTAILEADPHNLRALRSRGYEYLLVGRPDDSIRDSEAYIKEITDSRGTAPPRDEIVFLNLAIARGMLGPEQYPKAKEAVMRAIASYDPSKSGLKDSFVALDIQAITGRRTLIAEEGWQYLVGLHYEAAVLEAWAGNQAFEGALKVADKEASNHELENEMTRHPEYIVPPLLAMNWAWLQSRERPEDYGLLAASGALWERAAKGKADLRGCAAVEYAKFQKLHSQRHLARYDWLAEWVSRQKQSSGPCNLVSTKSDDPRELSLEAKELEEQVSGDDIVQLAQVEDKLTRAIEAVSGNPKDDDFLIELLIRRAHIRYRAKDLIGVREDCDAVLLRNKNVSDAYYYLAKSDTDPHAKLDHFEAAFRYAPGDAKILLDFSDFLRKDHPERALSLLERCVRFRANWSSVWRRIGEIQYTLHQTQQALTSLNTAIALDPTAQDLYETRKKIEDQLDANTTIPALHLAAGYRDAGDAERHIGHSADALAAYLKGLHAVCSIEPVDADVRFERERSVRNLSDFLATAYSKQYAIQFWRTVAEGKTMGRCQNSAMQDPAVLEAKRLAGSSPLTEAQPH
jgi:tetratricopeptide (TPR) repeat protein